MKNFASRENGDSRAWWISTQMEIPRAYSAGSGNSQPFWNKSENTIMQVQ